MKKIVYKVENGMDRKNLKATTYQMRNFYTQLKDGFFSVLDIMNYIQHYAIAKMMHKDDRVLDMCCGRSLLLPLIRYHAKDIKSYDGIDIKKNNMIAKHKRVTDGKLIDLETYYPFEVNFTVGDVAEMPYSDNSFNFIVYTSSIEHMQKEDGEKSLKEAYRVLEKGGTMIISCPNTPEDQDGYDTQYKAHIYEWKISELEKEFVKNKFFIKQRIGLLLNKKDLDNFLLKSPFKKPYKEIIDFIPSEFYIPVFATPFYKIAKEVLYILKK